MSRKLTTSVTNEVMELLDKELKDKLDPEYLSQFKEEVELVILNAFYENGITP
jgi:hypothetical protein